MISVQEIVMSSCLCVNIMFLRMYLDNELYKFVASIVVTDVDMPSMTSVRC